jgi:creatinine amidohydrolase
MENNKVLYEELRPEEFVKRLNESPIAYLPLGTLEWHGLHLPLGSDGLQAKGVFTKLAEKIGGIVLPMLFLGPDKMVRRDDNDFIGMDIFSFEEDNPQQLVGSAYYINEELFVKLIEATLYNLSRAGFKIVVAHGHGPSTQAFRTCIDKFEKQFGLKLFELWELGGGGNEGIMTDHAAFNETSLMMGLYPELTDLSNISSEQDMVGIWGDDPRSTSEHVGISIIEKNMNVIGSRLQEELSKLIWKPKFMKYTNMKKLYNA